MTKPHPMAATCYALMLANRLMGQGAHQNYARPHQRADVALTPSPGGAGRAGSDEPAASFPQTR